MYHLSSSINNLTIHYLSLILFLDIYLMHGKKYNIQYIVETLVLTIIGKEKFENFNLFGSIDVNIGVTTTYYIFIYIKFSSSFTIPGYNS